MSNAALTWVTEHSPYRGGKYALHFMLADTASDPDFELWGRQQYFADKARIDRARCCVYLKEMVDEGTLILVEDHSKRRKPNRYRMVMPEGAAKVFDRKSGAYARNMPTFSERAEATGETCAPAQHVQIDKVPSCADAQQGHVRSEHKDMCADATQNPSPNPSSDPSLKNARGDGEPNGQEGAPASGRARDSSGSSSARSPRRRSSGARAVEDPNALPGIATSGADAPAAPPGPAGPPHGDEMVEDLPVAVPPDPGVPAVVRALGKGVAKHGGKAVKTGSWEKPIDLLLRRGPTEWAEPEPVPVAEVLAVIKWLFDGGTIKRGTFCWADQVQSGAALRKYWIRLKNEADGAASGRSLTPVAGGGGGRPGQQTAEERRAMFRDALAEEQGGRRAGAVEGRVVDVGPASYTQPRRAV